VLPALPLLLLALACTADALARASFPSVREGPTRLPRVGLALLAAWALAFAGNSAGRLSLGAASSPYQTRTAQLVDALDAMRGRVPADAVVGAPELWPTLNLIAGVRVIPSARFRPISPTRDPVWGTPRQQLELWALGQADYLVLEAGGHVNNDALDALQQACPGSVQLLATRPSASLVRLGWDEPCRRKLGLSG
jgi:hypothetical protein